MARDGAEILADDEERDVLDFMLEACGLDSRDFYRDERILTSQNLEKNFKFLEKMVDGRASRRAPYFVLGYLMLITGAKIDTELRRELLEISKWEYEVGLWSKDFIINRKTCLDDFREKIKIHRPYIMLRPVKLKYFCNLDSLKTIIGLKNFNKTIDTGETDKIHHIKLDGWNLKKIPDEIFRFRNLRSLSLEFNQIKDIPNKISKLSFLEYLDLGYNYIESFSNSILELDSLTNLYLDHNLITNIPKGIINLKSIEYLGLNNNSVSYLPVFLKDLNSLRRLSIRDNKIKEIPKSFNSARFSIFLN